jgi:hypothetical protein
MPKDYNLLPPHSQELLRAARSGALYKRKAPPEEEDVPDLLESSTKLGAVPGLTDAEKAGDKKASTASKSDPGIKVKVWRRVAREAEAPAHSYLAKRHKNTITLPSKASATQFSGPTVTRVTVRRVDAAGNAYEQTITINDDDQLNHLDGEIVSTTVIAAPVAADPVAQQQPTPNRKRPPPPPHKKKHKGPGRGRKKKLGVGPLPLPLKPGASANPTAGPDGATDIKPEVAPGADVSLSSVVYFKQQSFHLPSVAKYLTRESSKRIRVPLMLRWERILRSPPTTTKVTRTRAMMAKRVK